MRRTNQHTGLAEAVRREIAKEPGTTNSLCERMGIERDRMKPAVRYLCEIGGAAAVPWSPRTARVWAAPEWIREQERLRAGDKPVGAVAGRIEIGRGMRWWASLG